MWSPLTKNLRIIFLSNPNDSILRYNRYETAPEDVKKGVGLRVFNVLKHWIEKAWHDFDKDAALPERCMDFLDRCISSNDPLKGVATGIRTNLVRKKSGEEATVTKASTNPPPTLLGPRDTSLTNLMDLNAEEIARQLTLIEWDIWVKIQPWECLGTSWQKKNKETAAPNVLALINRFNVVSGWVGYTICTLESVKKRSKAIGKFLEISAHLIQMGNLNGVFEIVAGLHHGAVFRMKQAWEGISSQQRKIYEEVKKLTDRSMSYASLRFSLKKLNPPCIPYLGVYLTDLTFIEEGNKDNINNLINWNKRHLISETIRQIRQYQWQAYVFTPVPWLQTNLMSVSLLTDDELYELSEWLEVRLGKERGAKPQALIIAQKAQEAAAAALAASQATPSSSSSSSSSGTGTIGRNSLMSSNFKAAGNSGMSQPDSVALESGHNWPFYEPDTQANIDVDPMTNTVRSGTLIKIVERLTHNAVNPDSNALYGFLVMYRSFSDSNTILDLLIQRWNVPPPKDKTNLNSYNDLMVTPIHLRVCNFLKTWLDRHFSDFDANPDLKAKLKNFITGSIQPSNEGFAKMLLSAITKQEAAIAQAASPVLNDAPTPIMPPSHLLSSPNLSFYDLPSEEVARQLSLIHHRSFAGIRTEELQEQIYRSDKEKDTKARHVVALQSHYQALFSFVKNELINADAQQQGNVANIAVRFLELVSRLVSLQNFFAARAIVEAIDTVLRTKPHILDNVTVDARNTFNETKENLVAKASSRASCSPPMVLALQPFFNDINSAELAIGHPLADKRINFERKLGVTEILVRLMTYQKLQYSFVEVPLFTQVFLANRVVAPATGPTGTLMVASASGSNFSVSPNSTFGAPLRASTTGSVGEAPGGALSTLAFFMMDLVLHDDEIKHEIQDIATDVYKMNVALIQDEIQQLTRAGKAAGTKLNFSIIPPPKAPMPVYVPPPSPIANSGLTNPAFASALGTTPGSPAVVVGTPPLSNSLNSSTGGASSTGPVMPPANFGNPIAHKAIFQSAFGTTSLGPGGSAFSNPGLASPGFVSSASNPALRTAGSASPATPNAPGGFINPALGNPALVASPAPASSPLVRPTPPSSANNPAVSPATTSHMSTNPATAGGAAQTEIPVRSIPGTASNGSPSPLTPKAGLKFPLPSGPGQIKRPISPSQSMGSVPSAPPSTAPPPVPSSATGGLSLSGGSQQNGLMQRSASGHIVSVATVDSPAIPNESSVVPPPQSTTPTPSNPIPVPGGSTSSMTNSGEIPVSTTPVPADSILLNGGHGSATSVGSQSPSVSYDGEAKKIPMPGPFKSRGSFTSASKQAGIRDLMAGLGKMSPSNSNTALRGGSNPLSGSGTFGTGTFGSPGSTPGGSSAAPISGSISGSNIAISTPPGTPTPSRSSSNGSINSDMTGSVGPMGSSLGSMGNSFGTSPAPLTTTAPVSITAPSVPVMSPVVVTQASNDANNAVLAQNTEEQLRILASKQLANDFPTATLTQFSAVEPGTNQTLSCDLLKSDRAAYVCSINPNITTNDINNLVRVGKLFKQLNPASPLACIVLTYNVDPTANELASRYKMKVYQFPASQ